MISDNLPEEGGGGSFSAGAGFRLIKQVIIDKQV